VNNNNIIKIKKLKNKKKKIGKNKGEIKKKIKKKGKKEKKDQRKGRTKDKRTKKKKTKKKKPGQNDLAPRHFFLAGGQIREGAMQSRQRLLIQNGFGDYLFVFFFLSELTCCLLKTVFL